MQMKKNISISINIKKDVNGHFNCPYQVIIEHAIISPWELQHTAIKLNVKQFLKFTNTRDASL